MIGRTE